MWNSQDEINEFGEAIHLYVAANGPPRKTNIDIVDSHIGGRAYQLEAPLCGVCHDPTKLLVQIRLPNVSTEEEEDGSVQMDRMLYTFGCPRTTCWATLKFTDGFTAIENGIMRCQIVEMPVDTNTKKSMPTAPTKSSWYADDDNNDWETNDDDNGGMESLEEAMAAMEEKLKSGSGRPKRSKKPEWKPAAKIVDESGDKTFPCFLLNKQLEPPPPNPVWEEDDVGLSTDDEKIRNMLARYMADEEDETILAALRGSDYMASGGGGDIAEEDERLSEEVRLLRGFQDRVQRVPRQVVRYTQRRSGGGGGGTPLWSIPSVGKNNRPLYTVPDCPVSGMPLSFEMQILPSLLHILKVDEFSTPPQQEEGSKNSKINIGDLLKTGMNWGSVAVYTSPKTLSGGGVSEGYLVVQASVDEDPALDEIEGIDRDLAPTMAVVEDMDDDGEFELFQ